MSEENKPKTPNHLEDVPNMKELVFKLIDVETQYKIEKTTNKIEYNNLLLDTDWDKINEERKEQGLSKLSNQSMKEAYIEKQLRDKYSLEETLESEYNKLRRLYDVAMRYSFDILR